MGDDGIADVARFEIEDAKENASDKSVNSKKAIAQMTDKEKHRTGHDNDRYREVCSSHHVYQPFAKYEFFGYWSKNGEAKQMKKNNAYLGQLRSVRI